MYSIHQVFQRGNSRTVTVVTSDTDIITLLLYHSKHSWAGKEIHVQKKAKMTSLRKQYELYSLHMLLQLLNAEVIGSLPAAYSLTGCDTIANPGTKTSMLVC